MSPARSFCPQCGSPLSGDGAQFCGDCGAKLPDSQPYAPPQPPPQAPPAAPQPSPQAPPSSSAPQPPVPSQFRPGQQPAGYAPQRSQKSVLWLVGVITAVVVVAVCTGSYFLFFVGEPGVKASTKTAPARPAEAVLPAQTAASTVESSATPDTTVRPPQTTTTLGQAETVSAQTITVGMPYDSGEGVYTGETEDGVPNGQGSFEMVRSDNGKSWSYEGRWENGQITGEGVMTQGDFVFTGSFEGGLLNGACEITDTGVLRYRGMFRDGRLHGQGTLYTKSGALLFEGTFDNDMLVESVAARQARGEAFMPRCDDMDEILYDGCMAEDNTFGLAVAVWGVPLAMGEQEAYGTIVIGHFAEDDYPVCLLYRYGVDEPKMTWDDWINAWGFVVGMYEYEDGDGRTVTCPMIEVVYWNSEQEGL